MNPYIGITDFTSYEQVQEMQQVFSDHLPRGSNRKLHVGVMMSYKTLYDIPSKWTSVFPAKRELRRIFASRKVYNCLHYADYDNNPDLNTSLARALGWAGPCVDAIQLDMVWPEPSEIMDGVFCSGRKVEVILQIGTKALELVDNDPQSLVEKLVRYNGVIHRVLLDKSGGQGIGMDAQGLIQFAERIRLHHPHLGIGAAGGLGPETLHLVEPLANRFPDISIDAQSRLRPSGKATDPIDWTLAQQYLMRALRLLT